MKRIFLLLMLCGSILWGCASEVRLVSVDNIEFARHIESGNVQLIDVRTRQEFAEGHIIGARNIDSSAADFEEQISSLDKAKPVALYCRSGRRSKLAAERVLALGYDVIELDKGILSWQGDLER